jgi:integrase
VASSGACAGARPARNRSKVLGRKRDAEAFDAELRRKRRTGELAALDAGKETLAEFGEEWWKLYAEPNLAATTLKVYAILWDTHVPSAAWARCGCARSRRRSSTRFRLELEAENVGRVSIHKAMTLLQGVLAGAPASGTVSHPIRRARSASRQPSGSRAVEVMAPDAVEAIRAWLIQRELLRDATLVSVLAYAGLRPAKRSRWPGRTCASARCSSRPR